MREIEFPSKKCSISDDWTYNRMQVVWMENDFLKIGILVGRGTDIFEFRYKPRNVNFMLRLEKDICNPAEIVSQIRDTPNQLEDYYYGGWQEVLPNSAPGLYRNAHLGQHGEVWMIPWKHAIIENRPQKVALKCWARPLRVPILIEKTLTLEANSCVLHLEETITNESETDLDIMWGHHIAFGLPFLEKGGQIKTNAKTILPEKNMPDKRCYKSSRTYEWPNLENLLGQKVDASIIPPVHADPYSELAYLSGFEKRAYYTIYNANENLGFSLNWDASIFKYLWYWQERYATQDAPWWGKTYAIALEPWTTKYPEDAEESISRGEFLHIKSRNMVHTSVQASVVDKKQIK